MNDKVSNVGIASAETVLRNRIKQKRIKEKRRTEEVQNE